MPRLYRALLLCSIFCLLACAGCANTTGYGWRTPQWASAPHLERVQVVVLDAREEDADPYDTLNAPKADVEKWTRQALQNIPGTTVVCDPAPSLTTAPSSAPAPATTLCRITIGKAANTFALMLLPPAWHLESYIKYDLELIDIPTGELRFKAVRTVTSGGFYDVLPLTDIPTLYQRDLAHVLKLATTPKEIPPTPTTTSPATPRP